MLLLKQKILLSESANYYNVTNTIWMVIEGQIDKYDEINLLQKVK